MAHSEYINFSKTRDFGSKINATFEFLKIAFKPLFKSLIYISGPTAVLAAIAYVFYMDDISNLFTTLTQGGAEEIFANLSFIGYLIVFSIAVVLAYVFVTVTTLEFINIYNEKKSPDIGVDEVWERVKGSFSRTLASMMLLFLMYIIILVLFGVFMVLLRDVIGMAILLGFIFFFVLIYVAITITLFYNILINENRGIGDFGLIIQRCFYLIKGKWWSTFGIVFITGLIVSMLGGMLQLPLIIGQMSDLFGAIDQGEDAAMMAIYDQSPFELAYSGVVMWARTLFQVIATVGITFQFYNLRERKEGAGLMDEIANIDSDETKSKAGDSEEDEDF